ncbi:hypothetical protein BpHYR1_045919 [Brachionus plicatilis]|uniref:Uncharacterized protein n=1 Tax=Brachionus plicatilis TaxID=10195 RepID=A0A3M7PIJ9_BRAPC|nr:hypothetical protein BpHYR1_045919 [Brachionus plicatilis]
MSNICFSKSFLGILYDTNQISQIVATVVLSLFFKWVFIIIFCHLKKKLIISNSIFIYSIPTTNYPVDKRVESCFIILDKSSFF